MTSVNIIIVLILGVLLFQYPLSCEEYNTNKDNLIHDDHNGWVFDCLSLSFSFSLLQHFSVLIELFGLSLFVFPADFTYFVLIQSLSRID